MVLMQIDSVVADIGVDAVKIGMIGSAETAAAVAERLRILVELHDASVAVRSVANPELLRERGVRRSGDYAMPQRRLSLPIVFDPVMVATSGAELAAAETIAAFDSRMDIATVVTRNLDAMERFGGEDAVLRCGRAFWVMGGHGDAGSTPDRT